ncbi:MAG: hypothetical protein KDD64_05750 [Bdellovibrionales bacterium]|nr:hypothetical protein [Bdellovibrionales bacterium]
MRDFARTSHPQPGKDDFPETQTVLGEIESLEKPPRLNPFVRRATVSISIGAIAIGAVRYEQNQFDVASDAVYGSLDNPRFAPSPDVARQLAPYTTFAENMTSYRDALLAIRAGKKGETPLSFFNVGQNLITELPSEYSPESAREFGRLLSERLLGQPLPGQVTLVIGEVGGHEIGGFANSWNDTATAEYCQVFKGADTNFFETTGTLVHEVGHLIFRFSEKQFVSISPWEGAQYESRVREEAAATLFRVMAAHQVSDSQARFALAGNVDTHIENFLVGRIDYGLNEGCALSDAALTASNGDFLHAWSMITTPGELDPILYDIIEHNRALFAEVQILESQVAQRGAP